MRNITQAERVLIHLYSYRHLDESERHGVPFDITQDGVGESVGISRSHASLILGKMERTVCGIQGRQDEKQNHNDQYNRQYTTDGNENFCFLILLTCRLLR